MMETFEFVTPGGMAPYSIPSSWDFVNVWGTVYKRVWVRVKDGDERQEWVTVRCL